MEKLSELLKTRGFVHQFSAETLAEITDGPKRTIYLGIDPTADSLHVGHLQNLIILRLFRENGHKVIALVGGGTGMIGDPSGKSEERNLLDEDTLHRNSEAIRKQIESVLGTGDFALKNNADWLGELRLINFLRDVGKHFTVNSMIKREMVRERLEKEMPISYTEFAYAILQAYDFLHLHEAEGCDLQLGASDQWGNIASGIELVRKKTGDTVYGLTAPLVVNHKTGKKFGKTEDGTVWLSAQKTSPFTFYQFWLNTDDEAAEDLLKRVTLFPLTDIKKIVEEHRKNPAERIAQRALAPAVTEIVHGKEAAESAARISDAVFGDGEIEKLSVDEIERVSAEAPSCGVRIGESITDVLTRSGLASSKREARQFITEGAVMLNGGKVTDTNRSVMREDFQNVPMALLKRGRRQVCALTIQK